MRRFDGPASGSSLTDPIHRDDINEAAADYETDSGSDSEADPDHYCSVPRNARGVDMKLVSSFHDLEFEKQTWKPYANLEIAQTKKFLRFETLVVVLTASRGHLAR